MISFSITHFYVVFFSLPPPVSYFSYRLDMSHPKTAKRIQPQHNNLRHEMDVKGRKCNIFS